MDKNNIYRKKQKFFKLCKNNNGFYLQEGEGYKKTYIDQTRACVFLYFEKAGSAWNITESTSGALVGSGAKTLKDAKNEAAAKINIVFNMLKNDEQIKKAVKIKNNLFNKFIEEGVLNDII